MRLKLLQRNGYNINNQPQLVATVVFESLSNSNLHCKRHTFLFPSNGKVTTLPVPRAGKKMAKPRTCHFLFWKVQQNNIVSIVFFIVSFLLILRSTSIRLPSRELNISHLGKRKIIDSKVTWYIYDTINSSRKMLIKTTHMTSTNIQARDHLFRLNCIAACTKLRIILNGILQLHVLTEKKKYRNFQRLPSLKLTNRP